MLWWVFSCFPPICLSMAFSYFVAYPLHLDEIICDLSLYCLTDLKVNYIYGGSGAHEAYPLHGQFTLLTMTYDARIWNMKMYVNHYSRCSSVREIVLVWNKGQPPELSEFDSAVPVRIRVEERNS
ncbi:hypothetical protein KY284_024611 [Solanum tuberosum]|nr:hypothetical protein KY284_024611 [Solanum tuberosum]